MKKSILTLIFSLTAICSWADDSGTCGENLTWTYVEATQTLTISGTGKMLDFIEWDGYGIKPNGAVPWYKHRNIIQSIKIQSGISYIGEYAFESFIGLTSITIPNSVKTIGAGAFAWCSDLTSISIPNSVTSIGNSTFSYCTGLTKVSIPKSMTSIGNNAFDGCRNLTSIFVEEGNAVYDSRNNCNAIIETQSNTLIYGCQKTIIPDNVTSIGKNAFYECEGLKSITIPNSVTTIGDYAFCWCTGLSTVTIGNSITTIGENAFLGCEGLESLAYYCKSIENWFNYDYKSNITKVTIGSGVKSIEESAFSGFTGLTEITIQNSVTSIGWGAFSYCTGLISIEIPSSVTEIEYGAFRGCSRLSSIKVNSENSFYDSRDNCNAIIESKTNTLIQGCQNTIIPNGVVSIGRDAFAECTGLTSIEIPSSIESISDAFYGCTGLRKVVISDLESYCKITISSNYVDYEKCLPLYYAKHLFLNDEEIKNLVVPTSITTISGNLFRYCDGIESIILHKDITNINAYAFSDCNNIQKISILSKRPPSFTFGLNPFTTDVYNNCTLYVPEGSENAYYVADGWKNFKKIETIKEQQPQSVPQDVNGDGVVDTQDVLEIYKYIQEH